LPAASAPEVAKAADEIRFRAEFKKRLAAQLSAWLDSKTADNAESANQNKIQSRD
jgi:hypothetical protein